MLHTWHDRGRGGVGFRGQRGRERPRAPPRNATKGGERDPHLWWVNHFGWAQSDVATPVSLPKTITFYILIVGEPIPPPVPWRTVRHPRSWVLRHCIREAIALSVCRRGRDSPEGFRSFFPPPSGPKKIFLLFWKGVRSRARVRVSRAWKRNPGVGGRVTRSEATNQQAGGGTTCPLATVTRRDNDTATLYHFLI